MSDAVIDTPAAPAPVKLPDAPAAAPTEPAPVASGAPSEPTPTPAPSEPANKFPDNWREIMAGELPADASAEDKAEHDKLIKRLHRLTDPHAAAKLIREQDKLIPTLRRAMPPKGATPEQMAEWRKEAGLPEKPDGYEIKLPNGKQLDDDDRKRLGPLLEKMHANNAPPEMVNGVIEWMAQQAGEAVKTVEARDAEYRTASEDALREEWGADYRANKGGIDTMMSQWPEDLRLAVLGAHTGDGLLADNPAFMRMLNEVSRMRGYVGGTVMPSGADIESSVEEQIADIERKMLDPVTGKRTPEYIQNLKMQERYGQLLQQRERLRSKAR